MMFGSERFSPLVAIIMGLLLSRPKERDGEATPARLASVHG
jgi:hypothetical protein